MKHALALLMLVLAAGCTRQARPVPPLQSLQSIAPFLTRVTVASRDVAVSVASLNRVWRRGSAMVGIRNRARDLGACSARLVRTASFARMRLLAMPTSGLRMQPRHFVSLLRKALRAQVWEARFLARAAATTVRDPFMAGGFDVVRVRHLFRAAHRAAGRAARWSTQARGLRTRHASDFRYSPVSPGTG
jgi:hypothetical protein